LAKTGGSRIADSGCCPQIFRWRHAGLIPTLHASRKLGIDAVGRHNAEARSAKAEGVTISTIVCAYNEAGYLAPCLHSVLAQTRRPDELLVVNNASTDDTALVARGSSQWSPSTGRERPLPISVSSAFALSASIRVHPRHPRKSSK
jgi:hypothetical protein